MTSSAGSFDLGRWWRDTVDVHAMGRMPLSLAVALYVGCGLLGALGEWHWARLGMNWEWELVGGGRPFEIPLARMLATSLALSVVTSAVVAPVSIALLQLALRVLGCTPQPFGVLYRVLAVGALAALFKTLPWVGYFLAWIAVLVMPVVLVARIQEIRLRTAALAVLGSTIAGLPVAGAVGFLVSRLL